MITSLSMRVPRSAVIGRPAKPGETPNTKGIPVPKRPGSQPAPSRPRPASGAATSCPVAKDPQEAAKSLPGNLARAVKKAAKPKA